MARTASLSEVEVDVDKRRLRPLALEGRPPGLVVVVVEEQQRMTRLEEEEGRLRVAVVVRMRCFNGCEDRLHSLSASMSPLLLSCLVLSCLRSFPSFHCSLLSAYFTSNGPLNIVIVDIL